MKISVSTWQTAILLGLCAFALRILYIALAGQNVSIVLGTDAVSYDEFARLMMKGWVWIETPLAMREPLYPALMAFSYVLPGSDIGTLQAMQVLLGTAAVVAVYLVLRSRVREATAVMASLFIALNPHFIIYSASLYRENLIIPLLAFFLILLFAAMKRNSIRLFIACAFAYALLVHTDVRFCRLA
jgi:4-amino-4-deoxy-L-arabinose transferase-like glycosyltransferase